MNFFKEYSSNTIGAGANQSFFYPEKKRTGLAFFKILAAGEYDYSLLFSDTIDSTYADGSFSRANMNAGGYRIESLSVFRCKDLPCKNRVSEWNPSEAKALSSVDLTFNGERGVTIPEGGTVFTDAVKLYFDKGDYIAIRITYEGKRVPSHPESMLPLYNKTAEGWEYSVDMPLPLMIGCNRPVKGRIAYLGDSITQGIGTGYNTYLHYCAIFADLIGDEYSHYNLGIGYARAADAASRGAWLERAKTCDTVFLCLGTNDVAHDEDGAESIAKNLRTIIDELKTADCRVILQTAPPFDRVGVRRERWFELNRIIREDLSLRADWLFDNVPLLRLSEEEPEKARYNGHPNPEGCLVWANAMYEELKSLF